MINKEKKLDQLLSNIEIESPTLDFTNDIMEMISDNATGNNPLVLNGIALDKEIAPMHMTDLVMDSIHIKRNASHSLIRKKDFQKLAIILCIGIVLTLYEGQAYLQTNSIDFNFKPSASLFIIVGGGALWIIDNIIRKMILGK